MTRKKLLRKLKKAYIKMLRHYALGDHIKGYNKELKAMRLELELKDESNDQR